MHSLSPLPGAHRAQSGPTRSRSKCPGGCGSLHMRRRGYSRREAGYCPRSARPEFSQAFCTAPSPRASGSPTVRPFHRRKMQLPPGPSRPDPPAARPFARRKLRRRGAHARRRFPGYGAAPLPVTPCSPAPGSGSASPPRGQSRRAPPRVFRCGSSPYKKIPAHEDEHAHQRNREK